MARPTETVKQHSTPWRKAGMRKYICIFKKKKTELHNAHQLFLLTKSMKDKQKIIIVILIMIVTNINWANMQ